jgi:hypothetical protein
MAKVVKRKILVEVGYHDFHFDDLIAANAFAMVAKTHLSDDSDRLVRVTVDYEVEEQEEEDKEEEQDDQTTD